MAAVSSPGVTESPAPRGRTATRFTRGRTRHARAASPAVATSPSPAPSCAHERAATTAAAVGPAAASAVSAAGDTGTAARVPAPSPDSTVPVADLHALWGVARAAKLAGLSALAAAHTLAVIAPPSTPTAPPRRRTEAADCSLDVAAGAGECIDALLDDCGTSCEAATVRQHVADALACVTARHDPDGDGRGVWEEDSGFTPAPRDLAAIMFAHGAGERSSARLNKQSPAPVIAKPAGRRPPRQRPPPGSPPAPAAPAVDPAAPLATPSASPSGVRLMLIAADDSVTAGDFRQRLLAAFPDVIADDMHTQEITIPGPHFGCIRAYFTVQATRRNASRIRSLAQRGRVIRLAPERGTGPSVMATASGEGSLQVATPAEWADLGPAERAAAVTAAREETVEMLSDFMWVLTADDVHAATGRMPLYCLDGEAGLARAIEDGAPRIDRAVSLISQAAQEARGAPAIVRMGFYRQTPWTAACVTRQLTAYFAQRPGLYADASVLDVRPDENHEPHVALVELTCTEQQQLSLVMESGKIPLLGTQSPTISFHPLCVRGGRRHMRIIRGQGNSIAIHPDRPTLRKLSDQGVATFCQELEDNVPPEGLTEFELHSRRQGTPAGRETIDLDASDTDSHAPARTAVAAAARTPAAAAPPTARARPDAAHPRTAAALDAMFAALAARERGDASTMRAHLDAALASMSGSAGTLASPPAAAPRGARYPRGRPCASRHDRAAGHPCHPGAPRRGRAGWMVGRRGQLVLRC